MAGEAACCPYLGGAWTLWKMVVSEQLVMMLSQLNVAEALMR